jgi:predicted  nucleic acid-binding Zn-ribbon protein
MNWKSLTLFFLVLVIAACHYKPDDTSQIRYVDSLLAETDSVNRKLQTLKIETVLLINDSLEIKMQQVDEVNKLKQLRKTQEHLRNILMWYDNMNREVMYSKNHLESMKQELETGDAKDTAINKDIEREEKILNDLNNRVHDQLNDLENQINGVKKRLKIYE